MNQEDWKEKYKQLALDMDALQDRTDDKSLKHLLFHMAVALEGQSEILDRSLASLRLALKGDGPGDAFHSAVKLVEKEVRGLEQDQERSRHELLQALQRWLLQLRQQLTTDLSKERLSQVESVSTSAVHHPLQLPGLMNDLLALQEPLLAEDRYSREELVNNDLQASSTLNAPEANDLAAEDDELLLQKISVELLTLMSGLHIPKADRDNARKLISEIERGVHLNTLPKVISDLVKLMADVAAHGGADFENYLLNLTSQLAEVQSFLVDSRQEEVIGGREVSALSRVIHQDVEQIHRAVNESMDLHELKQEVSTQLLGIVKSVDLFKRQEDNRELALLQRYQEMNSRLEQMEQETLQVKVHMEAERLKALTDPLTSLPNRAGYDEQIVAELARWQRYKHHFSVVVADLDLFKAINDGFGHLAGDKVLRLIGSILTRRCRSTDYVARYGGEEFVVLMPATTAAEAKMAMEKVRQAIATSPFNFHGKPVSVTMSFGVAEIQGQETAEELFERADKALYKAKREGRNRVELG